MEDPNKEKAWFEEHREEWAKKPSNYFMPKPMPSYLSTNPYAQNCPCNGDPMDYEKFLILEYGVDTYLRVKREQEEFEKKMKEFTKNPFNILAAFITFSNLFDEKGDNDDNL